MNMLMMRGVILLASIAIAGIIISQAFWIRKGLLINQSNFDKAVTRILTEISNDLEIQSIGEVKTEDPVLRLSPRSYMLNIRIPIDVNYLADRLQAEFANPFHNVDFSYEIYQSSDKTLVFSDTIFIKDRQLRKFKYLPNLNKSRYYVMVNFPDRPIIPSVMLTIWITAIIILTSVIIFFAYTLYVIFRQRRQSEFQKSFINNLAHEFKTLISTISISAQVLQEDDILDEPKRLKNYATVISNEVSRLKTQVNKILEIASIESNEMALSHEEFDIIALLDEISMAFEINVQKRNGVVTRKFLSRSCIIYADKVHFMNVINTLLDNALKYCDRVPAIDIEANCSESKAYVKIRDNGIGIAKENIKRVFEKFYRVPTGDVHNVKGYGLGLNYVKMVANAHGWHINVDSEVNKGSIFTITFPKN